VDIFSTWRVRNRRGAATELPAAAASWSFDHTGALPRLRVPGQRSQAARKVAPKSSKPQVVTAQVVVALPA
jgi:hypothetical protein